MDGVLMRRKDLERRSKKYAPVQNVSVVNGYMDAKDFHQKYGTWRVGIKKRMSPAAGAQSRIMIHGPKNDGTHMIELRPIELTALKELAAAGPRGRKSRAVRRDLARLIRAHYVTEQSASMVTVIYVITDLGRRALGELKGEMGPP